MQSPADPVPATERLPRRLIAILVLLAVMAIAVPVLVLMRTPPPASTVARKLPPRPARRVVPKAQLPPVEPTTFVSVDRDDARAWNAGIPFSKAPLVAARPFRITGDTASTTRAADCLASAVLYEAGDDTDGQRAVAQVVLNRVRHPAFPKTVCGVVFQGAERATGCQFTFTCDGALARRYADAAWRRARDVADAALAGTVDKRVGLATHYHTDWVVPYWSASLDKVSEVHTHLFFRWSGWWGTPPAFRGQYVATEPFIAKLAGIAPSHGNVGIDPATGEAVAPVAVADIPLERLPLPTTTDSGTFLITLKPGMSPDQWENLALATCGEREYCKLLAWTDRRDTPDSLPIGQAVIGKMAFSYLRDRGRSFEKALWNCDRFDRVNPLQCMKKDTVFPKSRDEVLKMDERGRARPDANGASPTGLDGVRRRTGSDGTAGAS